MPAARDQILIGFKCDRAFRAEIERAAAGQPISQFVRDAVLAKLRALGSPIDGALAGAPSRSGKGGPKKKRHLKILKPWVNRTARVAEEPPSD